MIDYDDFVRSGEEQNLILVFPHPSYLFGVQNPDRVIACAIRVAYLAEDISPAFPEIFRFVFHFELVVCPPPASASGLRKMMPVPLF
jgi:hypothetical protein